MLVTSEIPTYCTTIPEYVYVLLPTLCVYDLVVKWLEGTVVSAKHANY